LLPPVPTLTSVDPPKAQPAACAGDLVTVSGFNLAGATAVRLSNSRLGIQQTVSPSANPGNTSFQFTIPNPSPPNPPLPNPQPADLPVGVYLVSAQVSGSAGAVTTSGLPLAIAPALIAASLPATLASGTSVKLAVSCAPYVRAGQQVALLIGGQEAPADPFNAPTNSASFTFAVLAPTGQPVPVRLRVDGIDSPCVDMTAKPPAFVGPMIQVT